MEPKDSLLSLDELTTGPYTELDNCSQVSRILLH
jgi:hypothetical protein